MVTPTTLNSLRLLLWTCWFLSQIVFGAPAIPGLLSGTQGSEVLGTYPVC